MDRALIDLVSEAMTSIGQVTSRRMMGGATLYCDGTIFAIVGNGGRLWFKSDAETDAIWDEAGCERFTVEMRGRPASMNYRLAPEEALDDPYGLRRWGMLGLEAGRRAPPKRRRKRKTMPS